VAARAALSTLAIRPILAALVLAASDEFEVMERSAVTAPAQVVELEPRRDRSMHRDPRDDVSARSTVPRVPIAVLAAGRELAPEDRIVLGAHVLLGTGTK